MKGRLSGAPLVDFELSFELGPSSEYPVPSLQKIMLLSFSLPAMLGSRASKMPSLLESNPAFSYFQGVLVRSSRSFPLPLLSEQPVTERPAINRVIMVKLAFILLCIIHWKGLNPPGLKLPDQIII